MGRAISELAPRAYAGHVHAAKSAHEKEGAWLEASRRLASAVRVASRARHPWQPSGAAPPLRAEACSSAPSAKQHFYWPLTKPRDAAMDLASIADQMKMSREHALLGNYEAS